MGTGSAVPRKVVTNDELGKMMDTSDEWIRTRTGINNRHVLSGETLRELCADAAHSALENAAISAEELDLIICATVSADYLTPSASCLIQKDIGAKCPAFDINAACSGFIYAIDVAQSFFLAGKVKKVLIVAAEAMSRLVDWNDRSTCVLFGDGAGAVVLSEGNDLLSVTTSACGNDKDLWIPRIGGASPFDKHESRKDSEVYMNGQEVFKFAVLALEQNLRKVMEMANLSSDKIDYVFPHQANLRIISAAIEKLKMPAEKFIVTIGEYGNTSSSSIPIALDQENRNNRLKKGDILAMAAFGGGMTTGACIIRWQLDNR